MTAPATFTKWIRPSVPGCPDVMLLEAIVQAAIEFCIRTKAITESVSVSVLPAQTEYDLPITASYDPVHIQFVKRLSVPLTPGSRREHDLDDSQANTPVSFYLNPSNQLALYPTPVSPETLTASVAITPIDGATVLPDDLLVSQRYLTIAAGAKARLMLMENVPWNNPQTGLMERAMFDTAIEKEQLKLSKGGSGKRLRTQLSIF